MKRFRSRFALPALGLALAAGLWAGLEAGTAPAAVKASAPPGVTITVTSGKPSELAFQLSKISLLPAGTITFKVTDRGLGFHNFKLCLTPVTSTASNTCTGKATPLLKPGQSATLTVKLSKTGKYEYLCSVPGHAAAGMKGLIGVGVKVVPVAVTTTKATTTTATTTTHTGTGTTTTTTAATTTTRSGGGGGGTANECPPGQTIQSAGGNDADGDELGTEPTDNDGCL